MTIKRTLFEDIGGYDSERFPIAHSDVDLCFKARKAGASCVYTPHAELFHIGHVSIGKTDEAEKAQPIRKDKAEINTLKLWPDYIASDPFFTESMAGILYHDSPEYYRILPPTKGLTLARFAMDYILVFHDLSNSGAPRGLFECARHLIDAGHFVVAVSPTTGPYEAKLRALGAFVIVDELLFSRHPSVFKFCTNFDVMIANTVVAWPIVEQCAGSMPCFWYVHETGLVSDLASQNIDVIQAFKVAAQVWVAGKRGQAAVQVLRPDVRIVEYGFELPPMEPRYVVQDDSSVIRVAVVGSIEPRKGQDLAIAALRRLPDDVNQMFSLNIYGRTLDKIFEADIRRLSENMGNVHFHGEVSTERALLEISRSHILLVPSRDEPFSIVGLDAMAREVVVICGPEVGLHDYLTDSVNALLVKSSAPEDLALGLVRALALRSRLRTIGQAARTLYEEIFSDVAFKKRVLAILEVSGVRE